jgi:hypothetical protein
MKPQRPATPWESSWKGSCHNKNRPVSRAAFVFVVSDLQALARLRYLAYSTILVSLMIVTFILPG